MRLPLEDIRFSDISDDSLSSETLQYANRLSDTPRRIAQAEQRLPAEAIPTDWQSARRLCELTYIQLIFVKLVLNERTLLRPTRFQPALSTNSGLTRTRTDKHQAISQSLERNRAELR